MVVSLDLPSSRTRAKQVTSKVLSKKMGEMWESPATKKVMRQMAKTPKSEVAAVKKGKQTTGKPIKLRDLWWRYYHRRMLVRCEMHNDVTIIGDEVPAPGTINDPYMELVTCGNAYRHLDSGDHVDGAAVRKHLGIGLKQRPTDAHIASMLGPCCLRVAGFNEERMQQWAAAARGLKSFESLAGSEMLSFPYSKAEALNLSTILATIYDSGGTAGSPAQRSAKRRAFATGDSAPFGSGPPWFQGGASQVQGYDGWANALVEWYDPTVVPKDKKLNKGDLTLAAVVPAMRAAATWQEANLIVQRLRRVGDFAAAQGLCTLVFGVFEGDFSKVFGERFDRSSLQTWCGFGPGPAKSIGKMFGSKYTGNELRGIQWLCENAEKEFERLGYVFPYLKEADGSRRELTCVDMEHSLCYFSRYLTIRENMSEAAAEQLWRLIKAGNEGLPADQQFKRWKIKELALKSKNNGLTARLEAEAHFADAV